MGKRKIEAALVVAMAAGLAAKPGQPQSNEDQALAALLDDLGGNEGKTTEGTTVTANDAVIEPATPAAADAATTEPVAEQQKGKTEAEKVAAKAAKEAAKLAAKEKRDAERAAKKAARDAEASAKPEVKRWGSNKVGRIKETLGDQPIVLELGDALLTPDELKAKSDAFVKSVGKESIKVKNRAALMIDYIMGKAKEQTFVHGAAFKCLVTDGKLTSGDSGNLHAVLIAKPYSVGAARAMGRNTINTLVLLKVVTPGEKGTFLVNEQSMVLAKVKELMKL
jgi:hypothetical protein